MYSPDVYLAAPFFNPVQEEVVRHLETVIDRSGYNCHSPQRDGTFVKPDDPSEVADKGFQWNVDKSTQAIMLVAFIDWLTPAGHEIREVSWPEYDENPELQPPTDKEYPYRGPPTKDRSQKMGDFHSPPLNITDNGTSFEMGMAFISGVPIITVSLQERPLNLMLARSVIAHCAGDAAIATLEKQLTRLREIPIFKESSFDTDDDPCDVIRTGFLEFAMQDEELTKLRHSGPLI